VTRPAERGTLLIDATGVGASVIDLLRDRKPAASLYPVIITAGESVTEKDNYTSVPKKDLVSSVSLLLQQKALVVPSKLPFAQVVIDELLNFRSTIHVNGNATYGAWRERDHDDLVLALALATWMARRKSTPTPDAKGSLPFAHDCHVATARINSLQASVGWRQRTWFHPEVAFLSIVLTVPAGAHALNES
jgi:hypothetical protein